MASKGSAYTEVIEAIDNKNAAVYHLSGSLSNQERRFFMNRTMKVFLACVIGAFVGTVVALQINGFFWWLGLLAGGFTGYLSYEFGTVIKAVPRAWKKATSWRFDPDPLLGCLADCLLAYITRVMWMLRFSSYIIILFLGGYVFTHHISDLTAALAVGGLTLFFPLVGVFEYDGFLEESYKEERRNLLKYNAFTFTVWHLPRFVFWYLPRGIIWCAVRTPSAMRVIGRFLWHLFRIIHSEERLLCGVDAALGTLIGYFAGNALIGALAGGFFGVLNYEIISKRILRLVSVQVRK